MTSYYEHIETPVGDLRIAVDEAGRLCRVAFLSEAARRGHDPAERGARRGGAADAAAAQLREYFDGQRREFDLPLALEGSDFQRKVWRALLDVPYGATASYGEIARRIGAPLKARAVGRANGDNPIPIVVPCHRIIGSDGALTGYGGGLHVKRYLLELEASTGSLPLPGT
ncbi:methylated-DNA--[protein]-cysteine S-methyltransferase [soil metagenome]